MGVRHSRTYAPGSGGKNQQPSWRAGWPAARPARLACRPSQPAAEPASRAGLADWPGRPAGPTGPAGPVGPDSMAMAPWKVGAANGIASAQGEGSPYSHNYVR